MDIVDLRDLYRKIGALLGSNNPMEKRQRFMITTSMADLAQGLTNSLLLSLTWRDIETNKSVLQLMLE